MDVPHEGRNPCIVEVPPSRGKERCLERGQAAVVGDDLEGVLLVAEQLVVEDLVDDEPASVDAARVVDVVEVGPDPGDVTVEDARAQRVVLFDAHDRDADLVVGDAGHALEGYERVALRVGVDRLLDGRLFDSRLLNGGLAGIGGVRRLIGVGRLRGGLGLLVGFGRLRLGGRLRRLTGVGRLRRGCIRCGRGRRRGVGCRCGGVAAGAVAAGRGHDGYGAEHRVCVSASHHRSLPDSCRNAGPIMAEARSPGPTGGPVLWAVPDRWRPSAR